LKDFDALTARGRVRRERGLALHALESFDVQARRLHLLKYSWNTVFRVDGHDGRRYALRISRRGVRDPLDVESELLWMAALGRDTDVVVPAPVRTREGDLVAELRTPGVPIQRSIALFEWVGGRHVIRSRSERIIALLGETMARLHNHAETFVPPERFTRIRFDRIGSFSKESEIYGANPHPLVRGERRTLLRRETERVQAELDRLYSRPDGPLFLHLDMHFGNVKLQHGRLAVLDFDDSMWAYPVQDIGISLYYLRYLRGLTSDVLTPFKEGYTRLRDWPEEWDGQLDLMIEARALDLVDVFLSLDNPRIQAHLPRLIQGIEDQLRALSGTT
jgi:Ser/Thr protein kinase RdoA (MazF antagonist)